MRTTLRHEMIMWTALLAVLFLSGCAPPLALRETARLEIGVLSDGHLDVRRDQLFLPGEGPLAARLSWTPPPTVTGPSLEWRVQRPDNSLHQHQLRNYFGPDDLLLILFDPAVSPPEGVWRISVAPARGAGSILSTEFVFTRHLARWRYLHLIARDEARQELCAQQDYAFLVRQYDPDDSSGENDALLACLLGNPLAVATELQRVSEGDHESAEKLRILAYRLKLAQIERLKSGDNPVEARQILRLLATDADGELLGRLFAAESRDVRLAAVTLLGELGTNDALVELCFHLADPDPLVRQQIVQYLQRVQLPLVQRFLAYRRGVEADSAVLAELQGSVNP